MLRVRPLWDRLCAAGNYTVFQNFELNLLAAVRFADREEPYVICAESERGAAIVPAVLRRGDETIRLLGEEHGPPVHGRLRDLKAPDHTA